MTHIRGLQVTLGSPVGPLSHTLLRVNPIDHSHSSCYRIEPHHEMIKVKNKEIIIYRTIYIVKSYLEKSDDRAVSCEVKITHNQPTDPTNALKLETDVNACNVAT